MILTGKQGTADREGTLKYWGDRQDSNAYDLADATSRGDKAGIARAQAALKATQAAELLNLRSDLSNRQANSHNPGALNDTANINIDKGAIAELLKQQQEQAEESRNATDEATKAKLDAQKAGNEAAKKAAHERVEAMQTSLDAIKLQYGMSIKATYDFWELKKSTERAGSIAYNDIVRKQSQLAVEGAAKAHETIVKAIADAKRSGGQDATTGPDLINQAARFLQGRAAKTSADSDSGARDSNQLDMNRANTTARLQEAQITDAAGDSMTRYAAAVAIANVHAKELKDTLFDLKANIDIAQRAYDTATDPEAKRQAGRALTQARNAYSSAQTSGAIQAIQDNKSTDPGFTSATTGAADALNEFVRASRDSAAMMRDLVTNTLSGLNNQLVTAMTGGKTNFRQFGLGVTRDVAGAALHKGEGAVMGLLGFGPKGKLGTKNNPIYTMSAEKGSDVASAASGLLSKAGGVKGFFGKAIGMLTSFLPHFANGGSISGPSLVGENGPELYLPSGPGTIVPNHQLSSALSSTGGGQNIYYSINAQGTDPVQTEMRVRSAIVAAHQSSVKQAVKQVHQQSARQPARSR